MSDEKELNRQKVIEFIRSEKSDSVETINMATPIESIQIDSIDVMHVIFKFEEEFGVHVDLPQFTQFKTIGDFVEALLAFIPEKGKHT